MKLLIDAFGCVSESRTRGIGRYSQDLIASLSKCNSGLELHLLINYQDPTSAKLALRDFERLVESKNIHFWAPLATEGPFDLTSEKYKWSEKIYRAVILNIEPDAVIFTEPFTQGISVLDLTKDGVACFPIIYDLIPIIYPEDYLSNPKQYEWYQKKIASMKDMTSIFTISDSSRREILEITENEHAINIGCDTSFDPNLHVEEVAFNNEVAWNKNVNLRGENFFLYTGGFDYRKSVDLLFKVFSKLEKSTTKNLKLVLAGKIPDSQLIPLMSLAKKLDCEESIYFLGYVSDSQLRWLYQNCMIFINPSRHEGFGLPVLEAMRAGVPILVADNTNHSELVRLKESKFETGNSDDFFSKLVDIYSSVPLRKKIIKSGLEQSEKYSWKNVSKRTLKQLEEIPSRTNALDSSPFETLVEDIQQHDLEDAKLIELSRKLNVTQYFSVSEPRLYIDISILIQVDAGSGVQRVVKSITREMLLNKETGFAVSPIYFSPAEGGFLLAQLESEEKDFSFKVNKVGSSPTVDFRSCDVFLGLDLNHNWVVNHKAVFDHVVNSPAKSYFVIYDLLPVKYPDLFDPVHNLVELHREWLISLRSADGVISISQAVADQYKEYIDKEAGGLSKGFRNMSFCLGSDIQHLNLKIEPDVRKKFENRFQKITKSEFVFLMVGTLEPRKDHMSVLNAMNRIWSESDIDYKLVIVGKIGWKMEEVEAKILGHKELGKRLFWFKSLSDSGLAQLYIQSNGLIAASIDEGFGLPIIEAAQNKLPVLARDIPVFREVGGSGISYFKDDSPIELGKDILNWAKKVGKGDIPNIENVRCISWKESSQQLLRRIAVVAE